VCKRERERKDVEEKCVCMYVCERENPSGSVLSLSLSHTHTHTHTRTNTFLFDVLTLSARISSAEEIPFNSQACLKGTAMRQLRLAGSLKLLVTFAGYSLIYRALLQKRRII